MDEILDGDVSCEEDVDAAMLEELILKLNDEKKVLEKEEAEVARMEEDLVIKVAQKEQLLTGFLRLDKDVQEMVETIGQKQKHLNEMENDNSSEHQQLKQMRSQLAGLERPMADTTDERRIEELVHLCAQCDIKLKAIQETVQHLHSRQRQLQGQQHALQTEQWSIQVELTREEANRQLDARIFASGLLR
uniref:Uncharacterized protein n=1 Tax=Eptatretus burgeri TaxID=7764 RepID=A0A8C4N8Y6_EPTBU